MNWCEKHDHYKRTCPYCEIDILQERLERVAAIVNVMEQHDSLDATTLVQLRQALSWVPEEAAGRDACIRQRLPRREV